MSYNAIIASPVGPLGIQTSQQKLIKIAFLTKQTKLISAQDTYTNKVIKQLEKYFVSSKYVFNLGLDFEGTDFQKRVWQALCKIPVGTTLSYGQLAKQLKTSPRAIGNACRRNPIPLVVPCHRIIAQNHLGGFSGATEGQYIKMKTWLLEHERLNK